MASDNQPEQPQSKKNGWGGRREGAGRPRKGDRTEEENAASEDVNVVDAWETARRALASLPPLSAAALCYRLATHFEDEAGV